MGSTVVSWQYDGQRSVDCSKIQRMLRSWSVTAVVEDNESERECTLSTTNITLFEVEDFKVARLFDDPLKGRVGLESSEVQLVEGFGETAHYTLRFVCEDDLESGVESLFQAV